MAEEKIKTKVAEQGKKEQKFVNPALAIGIIVAEAIIVLIIAFIVRGA